jgi:hypothetical protein
MRRLGLVAFKVGRQQPFLGGGLSQEREYKSIGASRCLLTLGETYEVEAPVVLSRRPVISFGVILNHRSRWPGAHGWTGI